MRGFQFDPHRDRDVPQRAVTQPRRAASMAAVSIFRIGITASKARLASALTLSSIPNQCAATSPVGLPFGGRRMISGSGIRQATTSAIVVTTCT